MANKHIKRHYNDIEAVDILHKVANLYTSTKTPRDYGTGDEYTAVEVHTLKEIADCPGVTVTELARDQGKTKGAISQILKKIESKGLIRRESDPTNDNKQLLYITPKGEVLDRAHRECDKIGFGESMDRVRELYTEEEVDIAFSIMESWLEIRRDVQQQRILRQKLKRKEEKKQHFHPSGSNSPHS